MEKNKKIKPLFTFYEKWDKCGDKYPLESQTI
jgi:hypothetical protein